MTADTYIPEAPPVDPAEALSLLSSLMRRYGKHAEHRDMIRESAKAQVAEIIEWERDASHADETAMAALTEQMRPLARIVMEHDPKGRKSVLTPAGEVNFRAGSTRVEVENRDAFMRWAEDRDFVKLDGRWLRQPPAPALEPNLNGIREAIGEGRIAINEDGYLSARAQDGELLPIPGVRLVKADETFSVKPRGDHGTV